MSDRADLDHLRQWIGAEESAKDVLTPALATRFNNTFSLGGREPAEGEAAPRTIHFCLCQNAAPTAALGDDGHSARGGFLPPVPLPRRMWAGSEIDFEFDLKIGDAVERHSRVADVAIKEGQSGTLCFVTVDHRFAVGGRTCVRDRQSIVYRGLQAGAGAQPTPADDGATIVPIVASPTLLFRYSALTFNGHRIHYDAPYATEVEGYPGLVVHGPLQATLLLQLAARVVGREPDSFSFRSRSTLYDRDDVRLHAGTPVDDRLLLWTSRAGGPVAMQAEAGWR